MQRDIASVKKELKATVHKPCYHIQRVIHYKNRPYKSDGKFGGLSSNADRLLIEQKLDPIA